jgi:PTH1 family peptidyl-tRNA hydrolase
LDKIVLGIGNPGAEYTATRHNIGFRVVNRIAEMYKTQFQTSRFKAVIAEVHDEKQQFLLVKPLTYVNLSGECAQILLNWYKLSPTSLLVITDDVSLPICKIRIRPKGSSGGHRGLESIITCLHTIEFPRVRIGIGRDMDRPMASYVLSYFTKPEEGDIQNTVQTAAEAVCVWLNQGIETAMNQYNSRKDKSDPQYSAPGCI